MTNWKNLDTLDSYKALKACKGSVDLTTVMAGESGADRAKNYSVPMAENLTYNFAAKEVDDTVLEKLAALAKEAELVDKFPGALQWCRYQYRREPSGSSSDDTWSAWRASQGRWRG